jgi:hypothetical protein
MYTSFGWHSEPMYGRLFILYLVVVCWLSLFRLFRLVRDFRSTPVGGTQTQSATGLSHARQLERQDARFCHQWQKGYADTRLIKAIAVSTFMLSFVFVTASAFSAFGDESNNTNIPGVSAVIKAGFHQCERLAVGLSVSAFLYALASVCEALLMRRKTNWRYALAIAKAGVPDLRR